MAAGPDRVKLNVIGVFEQRFSVGEQEERMPLLVLRDDAERELRLPIGSCEGLAIHVALQAQMVPRPLTHDLALQLLQKLSAHLDSILIHDSSVDQSFRATLHLTGPHGGLDIDARPGDAVAMALRAAVPIFVTEEALARAAEPGDNTP